MSLNKFISNSKKHFPNLKIKYKDQSLFMKILSYILFFNRSFMTDYITTIGNTIYFPNKEHTENNPLQTKLILLHEYVHLYDSSKYNNFIFSILYLFPQILFIFTLPIFFINWWVALLLLTITLLPLPAYFRMLFEKRAYMVSLYANRKMAIKNNLAYDLRYSKEFIIKQFNTSSYYYMWTFSGLSKEFDNAILKIEAGVKPYDDDIFFIIDELIQFDN